MESDIALTISIDGFGDCNSDNGKGTPILIEIRNGVPHVVVWGDINEEDATHIVSLANAAEDYRWERCPKCDLPMETRMVEGVGKTLVEVKHCPECDITK